MLARTDSRARALFLLIVVTLLAAAIGGRLVWWQVAQRDWLAEKARNQLAQNQQIPAERGEIRDRNGVLLATSVTVQSVFATPPSIEDAESEATLLAGVLGMEIEDLRAKLSGTEPWVWLSRRVSATVAERVHALDLPGIGMVPETKRVYPVAGAEPGSTLAAQVLGYVNVDGEGQYGIEGSNDDLLGGVPGSVSAEADVIGRRIADSVFELRQPVNGASVQLTLDTGLQHQLEQVMWDNLQRNHAVGVTGLVMDVHTGAILALATFPTFDGNAYSTDDPSLFINPAVGVPYEPGSVMKPFTVAAALDAGAISSETTVLDDGTLKLADVRIRNWDSSQFPKGHGEITASDVLELSNNIGAARIALLLGRQKLYEAFRAYGFGSRTGTDIDGEASGVLWDPDGPNGSRDITAAENAFGQGVSVTALQLVAAYAAIANGGMLVTPHVIAGWTTPEGKYQSTTLGVGARVMKATTAAAVLNMLVGSVDVGVAKTSAIAGYSVAGKTGTAQVAGPGQVRVQVGTSASGKPIYETHAGTAYHAGWFDRSFVGIAPASNPQVVTLIMIHRPAGGGSGLPESPAKLFHNWAPQMLEYLAIPPDRDVTSVAVR